MTGQLSTGSWPVAHPKVIGQVSAGSWRVAHPMVTGQLSAGSWRVAHSSNNRIYDYGFCCRSN